MEARQAQLSPASAAYEVGDGVYDEAFLADGTPRPHYEKLIAELGPERLDRLYTGMQISLADRRVDFGPPHSRAPFGIDPVPRLITADEWAVLEAGLVQRITVINAFLRDVYSDREIVAAGVMPARVLDEATFYEPSMAEVGAPVIAHVAGPDIVRAADGELMVLEDNLRTPSGMAYSAAGRAALTEHLRVPGLEPIPVEPAFDLLKVSLLSAAPDGGGDPSIALLTDGPISSAWFEHRELADRLGVPLVSIADLEARAGRLYAYFPGSSRQKEIQVLYNRTSTERLTLAGDRPSPLGGLLMEAIRRGNLACVNSFGTGVADDKAVHCYTDEMIRFYLGEEPILRSVRSYDLGQPEHREQVLPRLDELVVKPRWAFGGQDVVIGPRTPLERRRKLATLIRRSPERFVAQEMVMLSQHPTVAAGALAPRHVDLRAFVFTAGEKVTASPGALTRFARRAGELVVNSSRGGGSKDTWVLA